MSENVNKSNLLVKSPHDVDEGNLIGVDPREIPKAQISALQHPKSPIKAIRAKRMDCSDGLSSEVRKCVSVDCALWPYRMNVNPFHGVGRSAKPERATA